MRYLLLTLVAAIALACQKPNDTIPALRQTDSTPAKNTDDPTLSQEELLAKGKEAYMKGDLDKAEKYFESITKQLEAGQERKAKASFFIGAEHYRQGNDTEALKAFDSCIALDPSYADAYYNRAIVKWALKDKKGAIEDMEKCFNMSNGDLKNKAESLLDKFTKES